MHDVVISKEVVTEEKYSLEGVVLTYGFLSNKQTNTRYIQERENIIKVIRSGNISSPSAREESSEYDQSRYGESGDIPIDNNRVCFYLWSDSDPKNNLRIYAEHALWVGPVNILEGHSAHIDTGDDAIGVTSEDGKVEIPLESGKLILSIDMFIDIFPVILERANYLGKSLEEYMTESVYIVDNEVMTDGLKMTEIALANVTPAENVKAKVEKIQHISSVNLDLPQIPPYCLDDLGSSKKLDNNDWKVVVNDYVNFAQNLTRYDSRIIYGLGVVSLIAEQINNEELKNLSQKAIYHCQSQEPVSIF